MSTTARVACLAFSLLAVPLTRADSLLPAEPVPLDSLAAFRPVTGNWQLAGGPGGDPRHEKKLYAVPGTGVLVNQPGSGPNGPLLTAWDHGDLDLALDFLVTPGSNSGIYLQGRYEVQLFDSTGVKVPTFADCGGIYQRWDAAHGAGQEGYEGHAPKANASRAPGLWQHVDIQFRAPRFDAQGVKTANARFVKVVLNGFTVQEDVEVTGSTRSALFPDEQPTGPLMIQGDHGPVAVRHIAVKRYGSTLVKIKDLHLKFFGGPGRDLDHYAGQKPSRESALESFSGAVQAADDRGTALFTGIFEAPVAGAYEFRTEVSGPVRLALDGVPVVYPGVNSAQAGTVTLTAGAHAFQLEYQHFGSQALRNGGLKVWIEGPGILPQQLAPPATLSSRAPGRTVSIPVEPKDRILLQRTFVPLEHSRRLYACFVGSPAGVHYAYDLEQAALIGVWRGGFFEGRDLWHERAEDQEAHPAGPGFTLEGKPLLFQFGDHDPRWPDRAPLNAASRGYRLEANGQPVFLYEFSGVTAEDRIAPLPDGSGLTRTLKFSGKPRARDMWALLAEAPAITAQPDGGGFCIGDRGFYLDWPKDSPVRPTIRREGDRFQLLVRVTESGPRELTYNLVW